ncbi:MAG: type II/IV secretion system ATPase subunit [Candidatus Nanoarchaeia archaeon]|nr:type II/IV secretion system ATPase subunit [Candidatus Nanoarchaeia archaeon]
MEVLGISVFKKEEKENRQGIKENPTNQVISPDIKSEFKIEIVSDLAHLPEFDAKQQIDVKYDLIKPYASIHIHWDEESKEVLYELIEPTLDDHEKRMLKLIEDSLKEIINISFIEVNESQKVIEYLEKNVRVLLKEFGESISDESLYKVLYYIYRNFSGLNEIEALMHDYFIEDIECNGIGTPLYIVHRKYRNLKTNIVFEDIPKLAGFVEKLAQKAGKYVSYANPLLDGRLPDGSRVNATYSTDISSRGPTFTIRKFTKEPWTPVKLLDFRTASPEMLAYLWLAIEYESNIMVIGGTGSGKTSFLNALAFFIPPAARIVSIEDTKELNLMHENWLPSVAREGVGLANMVGQKHGEVSLFDLLKESFRQRPDFVIVGEIRGAEAFVLFQGMSSGHPSFGTMHAEDVETMIRRLETEPINLSPGLVESLDVVCVMIQTKVGGQAVRRVREINEIVGVSEAQVGGAKYNTPFVRNPQTDQFFFNTKSHVFEKIVQRHGVTMEKLNNEFVLRAKLIMAMYKAKIFGFKEVQDIINAYYKTPLVVLKKFNIIG